MYLLIAQGMCDQRKYNISKEKFLSVFVKLNVRQDYNFRRSFLIIQSASGTDMSLNYLLIHCCSCVVFVDFLPIVAWIESLMRSMTDLSWKS